MTTILKTGTQLGKSVLAISVAVSIYSVAVAPDWETDLGGQVAVWSEAIVQRGITPEASILINSPVALSLGGITGYVLGAIGENDLANWFFGGSSRTAATPLLDKALDTLSTLVAAKIKDTDYVYYVHRARVGLLSAFTQASSQDEADAIAQQIVEDVPGESGSDRSEVCTCHLYADQESSAFTFTYSPSFQSTDSRHYSLGHGRDS